MYKERVESMLEENRKLITETAVLNKNIENYKQVQEALEKKVSNMEKELQTYTKVKTKSAVAEAEMHQKKVLQEISEDGVNRMKHIYDHNNMKTKGTMTQMRDLNNQLVIERNWDNEKDYQMRRVPVKQSETQTEGGELGDNPLLFMNETDLNELIEKISLYDLEILKTSLRNISTAMNEPKDQETECNILVSNHVSSKELIKYASKSHLSAKKSSKIGLGGTPEEIDEESEDQETKQENFENNFCSQISFQKTQEYDSGLINEKIRNILGKQRQGRSQLKAFRQLTEDQKERLYPSNNP